MKKIKLVIVDDDNLCLLIASKLLNTHLPERSTYEIESFIDPLVGFETVKNYLERKKDCFVNEILVILLDISMPIMNGWQFLEALDSIDTQNQIKVFMHSSSLDESDQKKALDYNRVQHYFHKPLTPEKIDLLHSIISEI